MGQQTLESFLGGAIYMAPAGNQTLLYWPDRRLHTIKPTAGSLLMTLQTAVGAPMPWGACWLIVNPKDSSNSFTLRDGVVWSQVMAIGTAALIARVKNPSAQPVWLPVSFFTVL